MSRQKDKILVVGGAGYVGSILVRELLDKGYAVKVLDRLFFGDIGIRMHSRKTSRGLAGENPRGRFSAGWRIPE